MRAEVSFLKYENDAMLSRLFVIREAAGEISRRSAGNPISSAPSPPLPFPPPVLRRLDKPLRARSALHSYRIHLDEHANDFIIMSATREPTVSNSRAR